MKTILIGFITFFSFNSFTMEVPEDLEKSVRDYWMKLVSDKYKEIPKTEKYSSKESIKEYGKFEKVIKSGKFAIRFETYSLEVDGDEDETRSQKRTFSYSILNQKGKVIKNPDDCYIQELVKEKWLYSRFQPHCN